MFLQVLAKDPNKIYKVIDTTIALGFFYEILCTQEIGLVADSLRLGGAILKVIFQLTIQSTSVSVLPGDVVSSVGGEAASRD